jgi:hypothetical protein
MRRPSSGCWNKAGLPVRRAGGGLRGGAGPGCGRCSVIGVFPAKAAPRSGPSDAPSRNPGATRRRMSAREEDRRGPSGLTTSWSRRFRTAPVAGYLDMIDELRHRLDTIAAAAPRRRRWRGPARACVPRRDLRSSRRAGDARPRADYVTTVDGRQRGRFRRHRPRVLGCYYLGGNGAVHGGAVPLHLDELLGRLASQLGRTAALANAYLHVNFRNITLIDRDLSVRGWFERTEGHRRFLRGTIYDHETLCAGAEGLLRRTP